MIEPKVLPGPSPWSSDYAAARALARQRARLLVVQFCVDERPLCRRVRDETVVDPGVVHALGGRYLGVWLDAGREAALFRRLTGEQGAMATCVVDFDEDVVALWTGFAETEVYRELLDRAWERFPAIARARRESTRHPTDATRCFRLGEAYDVLESPRRAREAYEHALDLAAPPIAALAREEGGDVAPGHCREIPTGPLRRAEAGRAPIAAAILERLARLDLARGRNVDARGRLESAVKLDPRPSPIARDRFALTEALILFAERRLVEARGRLESLVRTMPASQDVPQALFTLGLVHHELRDDAAALATLGRVRDGRLPARWRSAAVQQIAHIQDPRAHQH